MGAVKSEVKSEAPPDVVKEEPRQPRVKRPRAVSYRGEYIVIDESSTDEVSFPSFSYWSVPHPYPTHSVSPRVIHGLLPHHVVGSGRGEPVQS